MIVSTKSEIRSLSSRAQDRSPQLERCCRFEHAVNMRRSRRRWHCRVLAYAAHCASQDRRNFGLSWQEQACARERESERARARERALDAHARRKTLRIERTASALSQPDVLLSAPQLPRRRQESLARRSRSLAMHSFPRSLERLPCRPPIDTRVKACNSRPGDERTGLTAIAISRSLRQRQRLPRG